jgi:hypothetical protein
VAVNGGRTDRGYFLLAVHVDIEPDVRMGTRRQFGFVNTTPLGGILEELLPLHSQGRCEILPLKF